MIRSVRGRVLVHEPEGPVVEVGGVGMLVRVSATTGGAGPNASTSKVSLRHASIDACQDALEITSRLLSRAIAAHRAVPQQKRKSSAQSLAMF